MPSDQIILLFMRSQQLCPRLYSGVGEYASVQVSSLFPDPGGRQALWNTRAHFTPPPPPHPNEHENPSAPKACLESAPSDKAKGLCLRCRRKQAYPAGHTAPATSEVAIEWCRTQCCLSPILHRQQSRAAIRTKRGLVPLSGLRYCVSFRLAFVLVSKPQHPVPPRDSASHIPQ